MLKRFTGERLYVRVNKTSAIAMAMYKASERGTLSKRDTCLITSANNSKLRSRRGRKKNNNVSWQVWPLCFSRNMQGYNGQGRDWYIAGLVFELQHKARTWINQAFSGSACVPVPGGSVCACYWLYISPLHTAKFINSWREKNLVTLAQGLESQSQFFRVQMFYKKNMGV